MQSGTLLHLALLRKISQLTPTPHPRDKHQFHKSKRILANWSIENQCEILPLVEIKNRKITKTVNPTLNHKSKASNIENMTISGWSTKSLTAQ